MLSIAINDKQHKGVIITKGAVEEVLNKCTHLELPDQGTVNATESGYKAVVDMAKQLNSQGLRLIAIAIKPFPQISDIGLETHDENDLTFVGFCTFLDAPKEDAADAIAALKEHGVDVKILTGDAPEVTFKVARDIGLITQEERFDDVVLSGKVLAGMTKAELATALDRIVIFAKLSPCQKLEVVQALRASGKVTGFLGDGVNGGSLPLSL
jgi:Mg2+-importing ATPase